MKKKNILAALFLAISGLHLTYAQLNKVPTEVTNNFTTKFPKAKNVEWQHGQSDYKVTFNEDDKTFRAGFGSSGDWKITERVIKKDYLPTAVSKKFLKSEYSKWEIKDVTVVETPASKIQFKITVEKDNATRKDLLYNTDGQLLTDNFKE